MAELEAYRTYDVHTVFTEALPQGGYLLSCYDEQYEGTLSYAQVLNAEGELRQRLDFTHLPDTIDGRVLYYLITDVVPWDNGGFVLLGYGWWWNGSSYDTYLLVYQVDSEGRPNAEPLSRLVAEGAVLYSNGSYRDELYSERAMGVRLPGGDLLVALSYSSQNEYGHRIQRFPLSDAGGQEMDTTILDGPVELWSFQVNEQVPGHVRMVLNQWYPSRLEVYDLDISGPGIGIASIASVTTEEMLRPYFLCVQDGRSALGGCEMNESASPETPRPFISTFEQVNDGEVNGNFHRLASAGSPGQPLQSYAGTWWNGKVAMLTNSYRSVDQEPWFPRNRVTDLGLALVDPSNGEVLFHETIVAGQGLRGIGLFNDGGHLVCIGTKYGYDNLSLPHTFFMRLKDPAL